MTDKLIYKFESINFSSKELFGNKGNNLAIMYNKGFPIPKGFILTKDFVQIVQKQGFSQFLKKLLFVEIKHLEKISKKTLGSKDNPLLLSIRSSGNISMPGILKTKLNVGTNTYLLQNWCLCNTFTREYKENPLDQIIDSIKDVIESLNSKKVESYGIDKEFTMGIIIQEMVFGNLTDNSYTGVMFTGNNKPFGEVLQRAQGDILVGGKKTPGDLKTLPLNLYNQLVEEGKKLEDYFKYIQDIEFTIEKGKLFILQTRNAQLTNREKFYMLEDFAIRGLITKKDFFIQAPSLESIKNNSIDYKNSHNIQILSSGIGITENIVTGYMAMNYKQVCDLVKENKSVIYITEETSVDHMNCILKSSGLVTKTGGATSHCGVIARGKNIVSILSLKNIHVGDDFIRINNTIIKTGEKVTLDGKNGNFIIGDPVIIPGDENYKQCNKWKLTQAKIKINGETMEDIENGYKFSMDGVGLCRIEHMFLEKKGKAIIKKLLVDGTNAIINSTIEYLKKKFIKIFEKLENMPINIRLLDPPVHEFLPKKLLKESNPMIGIRGARLLIMKEEVLIGQIEAIFFAYISSKKKPFLEIMIPFVCDVREVIYIKNIIKEIAQRKYSNVPYKFGVMIELPRCIFIGEEIGKEVDFVSFGTNDLTQMVFGLSRDDSSSILDYYQKIGILDFDPFQQMDSVVCNLIKTAVEKVRKTNPNIIIGICGEQGAHRSTLEFLLELKIDYISCSPFRLEQLLFQLNKYS